MMPFAKCHNARSPAVAPFYRATRAAATVIFTLSASQVALAEMTLDEACVYQEGSPSSCTHVVACIGDDTLFVGGTVGWDQGLLTGQLSTGATCQGIWDNATRLVNFTCDDGQTGIVTYNLFDGSTGTAIGRGNTIVGRLIEAWSGHNIAEFIEADSTRVTLQCGVQDLLLG